MPILAETCGPSTAAVTACLATTYLTTPYIDTVELFVRYLDRAARRTARERFGRRPKKCRAADGRVRGWRVIVNQPTQETLRELDNFAWRFGGTVYRFDIAFDMPIGLKDKIATSAILRWSRTSVTEAPYEGCPGSTVYVGHRGSPRTLLIYDGKPDRFTGEPCTHMELRFTGSSSVRRQGVRRVIDLLEIDPNVLLSRHVKWTGWTAADAEAYIASAVRREAKKLRQSNRQNNDPRYDRYLANVARHRIRHMLQRTLRIYRAQNAHKWMPRLLLRKADIDPGLVVPSSLGWREG